MEIQTMKKFALVAITVWFSLTWAGIDQRRLDCSSKTFGFWHRSCLAYIFRFDTGMNKPLAIERMLPDTSRT